MENVNGKAPFHDYRSTSDLISSLRDCWSLFNSSKDREFTDEEREHYIKVAKAQYYVDCGMNIQIALNKCGLPAMDKTELKALHWSSFFRDNKGIVVVTKDPGI